MRGTSCGDIDCRKRDVAGITQRSQLQRAAEASDFHPKRPKILSNDTERTA